MLHHEHEIGVGFGIQVSGSSNRQINPCTYFLYLVDYSYMVSKLVGFMSIKSLGGFMGGLPCKLLSIGVIESVYFIFCSKRDILKIRIYTKNK